MKEKDYEEKLRLKRKLLQEEEEEEWEINGCYLKLELMREKCPKGDYNICGLIEEQMELLNALREEKEKYLDEWEKRNLEI